MYPLSNVAFDSDALNVNIDVVGEIPRHPEPGPADAREVTRNPHDDDVVSYDSSSDAVSEISSSVEQITFDGDIDQKDTSHKVRSVSRSDDNVQLYTLVNGVTGDCDGTTILEAIP